MTPSIFSDYARYYDLLYRGKDYVSEAHFVDGLLRAAGGKGGKLLDVGCGTGMHSRALFPLGWHGVGVDLSPAMIELARARTPPGMDVEFHVGAAGTFDLGRRFSAVISLFHVVSYQSLPGEAARMFDNVHRHLVPGGIFVFDFWHAPGVLADPPTVRVQRIEDDNTRLTRIAEPRHYVQQQIVDVNYEVFVEDRTGGGIKRITELHKMKYFSVAELEALLRTAGFTIVQTHAGLVPQSLHERAWHGLIVAKVD